MALPAARWLSGRTTASAHGDAPIRRFLQHGATVKNASEKGVRCEGDIFRLGVVHAWVGQIVTFFAYRPPSRPQGSLTPRLVPSPGGSLTRLRATLGCLGKPLRQSAGRSGVSPRHRPSTGSCHRARSGSTARPGQRLPPCMMFRRYLGTPPEHQPQARARDMSSGCHLCRCRR